MPYSIEQLRAANGGLGNLSDEQIVQHAYPDYQQYFSSIGEYAAAVGYRGVWSEKHQNNLLTDSAYQGNTDRLPSLPSALFESLGATVLIAVVGWVVYKKYVQKSLSAKTPVHTGRLCAAGAALLTLSVIPHQFITKGFVDGLVATLTLFLMYSATGFCLGWAYRTVRPAEPRTDAKQYPNSAPGDSDPILLKVPVLAPSKLPLAQSGQVIKPPTEEDHWATALAELDEGKRRQGVWAKAFADSDGDEVRAKVAYLKSRVQQLTSAVGGS